VRGEVKVAGAEGFPVEVTNPVLVVLVKFQLFKNVPGGPSLYERYGLYKVPTSAGWTNAHASR